MIRFFGTGPRSLMRTITERSFFRSVTLTQEPSGKVRCAAVNWYMSYGSPLAVCLCWKMRPYHEAFPTWDFRVLIGGTVSRVCPGVHCRDSGVLLPGAAPSAVVKTNPAAIWLSSRNIKHLSSLSWSSLTSPVRHLLALRAMAVNGSAQLEACVLADVP